MTFLANYKHVYTQFGSSRPWGVSMMYAGWDRVMGFQLYKSDPSGNYAAWKAHATGKNSQRAEGILKDDYSENCSLKEALTLAVKVLAKSMDSAKPDPKKFEIGIVYREGGHVTQRMVEGEELEKICHEAKIFDEEDA